MAVCSTEVTLKTYEASAASGGVSVDRRHFVRRHHQFVPGWAAEEMGRSERPESFPFRRCDLASGGDFRLGRIHPRAAGVRGRSDDRVKVRIDGGAMSLESSPAVHVGRDFVACFGYRRQFSDFHADVCHSLDAVADNNCANRRRKSSPAT